MSVLSRSPGFGLVLIAETINGTFLGAEVAANPRGSKEGPSVPEDLGKLAANSLLEEVFRVGNLMCVHLCIPFILITTTVSLILSGTISSISLYFSMFPRMFSIHVCFLYAPFFTRFELGLLLFSVCCPVMICSLVILLLLWVFYCSPCAVHPWSVPWSSSSCSGSSTVLCVLSIHDLFLGHPPLALGLLLFSVCCPSMICSLVILLLPWVFYCSPCAVHPWSVPWSSSSCSGSSTVLRVLSIHDLFLGHPPLALGLLLFSVCCPSMICSLVILLLLWVFSCSPYAVHPWSVPWSSSSCSGSSTVLRVLSIHDLFLGHPPLALGLLLFSVCCPVMICSLVILLLLWVFYCSPCAVHPWSVPWSSSSCSGSSTVLCVLSIHDLFLGHPPLALGLLLFSVCCPSMICSLVILLLPWVFYCSPCAVHPWSVPWSSSSCSGSSTVLRVLSIHDLFLGHPPLALGLLLFSVCCPSMICSLVILLLLWVFYCSLCAVHPWSVPWSSSSCSGSSTVLRVLSIHDLFLGHPPLALGLLLFSVCCPSMICSLVILLLLWVFYCSPCAVHPWSVPWSSSSCPGSSTVLCVLSIHDLFLGHPPLALGLLLFSVCCPSMICSLVILLLLWVFYCSPCAVHPWSVPWSSSSCPGSSTVLRVLSIHDLFLGHPPLALGLLLFSVCCPSMICSLVILLLLWVFYCSLCAVHPWSVPWSSSSCSGSSTVLRVLSIHDLFLGHPPLALGLLLFSVCCPSMICSLVILLLLWVFYCSPCAVHPWSVPWSSSSCPGSSTVLCVLSIHDLFLGHPPLALGLLLFSVCCPSMICSLVILLLLWVFYCSPCAVHPWSVPWSSSSCPGSSTVLHVLSIHDLFLGHPPLALGLLLFSVCCPSMICSLVILLLPWVFYCSLCAVHPWSVPWSSSSCSGSSTVLRVLSIHDLFLGHPPLALGLLLFSVCCPSMICSLVILLLPWVFYCSLCAVQSWSVPWSSSSCSGSSTVLCVLSIHDLFLGHPPLALGLLLFSVCCPSMICSLVILLLPWVFYCSPCAVHPWSVPWSSSSCSGSSTVLRVLSIHDLFLGHPPLALGLLLFSVCCPSMICSLVILLLLWVFYCSPCAVHSWSVLWSASSSRADLLFSWAHTTTIYCRPQNRLYSPFFHGVLISLCPTLEYINVFILCCH